MTDTLKIRAIDDDEPILANQYIGFPAQPNPHAAALDFETRFGEKPRTVLVRKKRSGYTTCYIPIPRSIQERENADNNTA